MVLDIGKQANICVSEICLHSMYANYFINNEQIINSATFAQCHVMLMSLQCLHIGNMSCGTSPM